jgi:hypothetical protein
MQVLVAIVTQAASPWHPRDLPKEKSCASPNLINQISAALVWRGHEGRTGWQRGRELQ